MFYLLEAAFENRVRRSLILNSLEINRNFGKLVSDIENCLKALFHSFEDSKRLWTNRRLYLLLCLWTTQKYFQELDKIEKKLIVLSSKFHLRLKDIWIYFVWIFIVTRGLSTPKKASCWTDPHHTSKKELHSQIVIKSFQNSQIFRDSTDWNSRRLLRTDPFPKNVKQFFRFLKKL